ncbi:MAG: CCA tRNA nucleotidyltransferase [Alphaproteobacteria bacterium]|nr:CCA tRNA nucleotidyltransferase [Alphaproteobacteria bacterium]
MIKTEYLNPDLIIKDKSILKLFEAVENNGGVLRFVGGAVRDVLAGKLQGFEIDLATDLSPDELVEACQEANLKTVPIGLKYATTGVVVGDKIVEVSHLRKVNSGYKFSSEFEFTDDWNADASKRDLTINAVYADNRGNVFDYYNGVSDLENGIVKFIGNPCDRIKEQPVRIMRFFRFYSIFGKTEPDKKSLKACVECKHLLKEVAIEQIRDELFKIFLTDNIVTTLRYIFENDILDYILPMNGNLENLENLQQIVKMCNLTPDVLRRLYILYQPDESLAENLAARLHLTKKQKYRLLNWSRFVFNETKINDIHYLRKVCYLFDKDFCIDKVLFCAAKNKNYDIADIIKTVNTLQIPEFNIKGKDLINAGLTDYAKIKDILETLEHNWVENNFADTYDELKEKAKTLF